MGAQKRPGARDGYQTEAINLRKQPTKSSKSKSRKNERVSDSESSVNSNSLDSYRSSDISDGDNIYSRQGQYRKVKARNDAANHKYSTRTKHSVAQP